MFELYKEKVEIVAKNGNKDVYEIGPLTGEYLEDLYYVMDKFQGAGDKEADILKVLGTDATARLHKLVFFSLKSSYPDKKDGDLDRFAAQNLMKFIEPIIKVNMPSEE